MESIYIFMLMEKKEKKEEKKKNILPLIDLFTNVFTAKYQRIKKLATLIDNNKHNNCLNNLKLISLEEYIEKLNIVKGIIKSVISFNIEAKKEKNLEV